MSKHATYFPEVFKGKSGIKKKTFLNQSYKFNNTILIRTAQTELKANSTILVYELKLNKILP